ncbi:zinc finger and BTB domain-containing protein 14 [Musca vetustissima]|uniref:zinc finger and BTB domain-containing protein 14 n=1 Tax=Musca vetustissima TaxID=27455 RepID=UPI002AB741CD|nr:zinc finger and BTB domain-containing protein 14 [Musca vetustissima]
MEISIKWNICRVCLKEENKKDNEQMKPIFDGDGGGSNKLVKDIFESSGVVMKPNDGLPEKICRKCISVLKQAVYFRKTCRESNINLRSVLERTRSATNFFKKERSTDGIESDDNSYCEDDGNSMEDTEIQSAPNKKEKNKRQKTEDIKENIAKNHNRERKKEEDEMDEELDYFTKLTDEIQKVPSTTDNSDHNSPEQHVATPEKNVPSEEHVDDDGDIDANTSNFVSKMLKVQEMIDSDTFDNNFADEHVVQEEIDKDSNVKKEDESLYYIISNEDLNEAENHSNEQQQQHLKEDHISEENIAFVTFTEDEGTQDEDDDVVDNDEELSEQFGEEEESQNNDDDDNVSSTVITKDELDFEATYSSNSQQNIDCEYEIDQFIIHEPSLNANKQENVTLNYENKYPIKMHQSKRVSATTTARRKSIQNNLPLSCEICGNTFNSRQVLNVHMKIHRQEKTHECEICFKRFITACNLQAHMRIHTGEKPFECKFCGRRFSDRSTHIRHERIHTNEKPFSCDACGKSFALATTLQAHLKVHTGERPYRCDPCSKSFKLAHQLKAHRNTSLHKAVENAIENTKYIDTS